MRSGKQEYLDFYKSEFGVAKHCTKSFGLAVWQHQQSKVDELQKKNAWLSDVACRENKRANKLQEENINTTVLLGKTIQEKNELQKQIDFLNAQLGIQIDRCKAFGQELTSSRNYGDELQKRVDKAIRLLVEAELYQSEPNIDLAVQALNGGEA